MYMNIVGPSSQCICIELIILMLCLFTYTPFVHEDFDMFWRSGLVQLELTPDICVSHLSQFHWHALVQAEYDLVQALHILLVGLGDHHLCWLRHSLLRFKFIILTSPRFICWKG